MFFAKWPEVVTCHHWCHWCTSDNWRSTANKDFTHW